MMDQVWEHSPAGAVSSGALTVHTGKIARMLSAPDSSCLRDFSGSPLWSPPGKRPPVSGGPPRSRQSGSQRPSKANPTQMIAFSSIFTTFRTPEYTRAHVGDYFVVKCCLQRANRR